MQTDGKHGGFQLREKRKERSRHQREFRDRGADSDKQYFGGGPPRDFGSDRWSDYEPVRSSHGDLGGPGGRDLMGEWPRQHAPWDDWGGPPLKRRRAHL
jgi:hypothetical protein